MEFFKLSKGKFVACPQNQASFMRVTQDGKAQMVSINTAGLPRSARPLVDATPKGRVHVFDIADKTPFSGAITVSRPERAEKIAVVRERRETEKRAKTVGNGPSITKGEKAAKAEENTQSVAATIAEFFVLVGKAETLVNGGLFSAANESILELRQMAGEVPTKQRANLRNALRLLVAFKNEAVKSDREKRKETVRQERTAKSAERAAAIKSRRDGIAMAKANKEVNAVGRGPAPFYTARTGQAVARQLAERRNRERAMF